jgi:hypothetical protein
MFEQYINFGCDTSPNEETRRRELQGQASASIEDQFRSRPRAVPRRFTSAMSGVLRWQPQAFANRCHKPPDIREPRETPHEDRGKLRNAQQETQEH